MSQQDTALPPGDWALAAWHPAVRCLELARSPIGILPLFYCATGARVWFASAIAPLLEVARWPRIVDRGRAYALLQGIEGLSDRTSIEGVFRVRAARSIFVDARGLRERRVLWDPSRVSVSVPTRHEDCVAGFRARMDASVEANGAGAAPLAVEVSGGLDSAAVAASARSVLGDGIVALSVHFAGLPDADESVAIRAVVDHHGLSPVALDAASLDPLAEFDRTLAALGEPHFGANIYVTSSLADRFRGMGGSVCLNGVDGDNVARHGLHGLTELATAGRWSQVSRLIKSIADIYGPFYENAQRGLFDGFAAAALAGHGVAVPASTVLAAMVAVPADVRGPAWTFLRQFLLNRRRLLAGGDGVGATDPRLVEQERLGIRLFPRDWFAPAFFDAATAAIAAADDRDSTSPVATERGAMEVWLAGGVNEGHFELQHAVSRATGVELRSPFMSRGLIEYCLAVPAGWWLRGNATRALLRDAYASDWPEAMRTKRRKGSLEPAFIAWFDSKVIPEFERMLGSPSVACASEAIFDPGRLAGAVVGYRTGRHRTAGTRQRLWAAFALLRWITMTQGRAGP